MNADTEQLALRRGLIAELIRSTAHRDDVGPEARRLLIGIAKALSETPGVDGTCRRCGEPIAPQYAGRPRNYCSERCSAAYRKAMSRKVSRKTPA